MTLNHYLNVMFEILHFELVVREPLEIPPNNAGSHHPLSYLPQLHDEILLLNTGQIMVARCKEIQLEPS